MERVVCLFKVELHVPDPLLPFTESVTFDQVKRLGAVRAPENFILASPSSHSASILPKSSNKLQLRHTHLFPS